MKRAAPASVDELASSSASTPASAFTIGQRVTISGTILGAIEGRDGFAVLTEDGNVAHLSTRILQHDTIPQNQNFALLEALEQPVRDMRALLELLHETRIIDGEARLSRVEEQVL